MPAGCGSKSGGGWLDGKPNFYAVRSSFSLMVIPSVDSMGVDLSKLDRPGRVSIFNTVALVILPFALISIPREGTGGIWSRHLLGYIKKTGHFRHWEDGRKRKNPS